MEDYETRRPGGWYPSTGPTAEEIGAWYGETPAAPAAELSYSVPGETPAAPAPAAPVGSARRRRKPILWIAIGAAALLVTVFVVLSVINAVRNLHVEVTHSELPPSAFAVPDIPGVPSIPGVPDIFDDGDYQDDFREYFEEYYSNSSAVDIERAENGTGVTLTLHKHTGGELSLQEIYEIVSPAVVGITTYRDGEEYSWGTGVIFTEDGYIITNTHIIQGTDEAVVSLTTGEEYAVRLVGEDDASDIAVLKIDAAGLPYAEFGDSDELYVGDDVAAIGNPLGEMYAGTMTNGIVSAINRNVMNNGHNMTLLQTNAALNEGNSGGPLVNVYGQVIGITNMKIMSVYYSTVEGIGFAIPSTVVKQIADQLIEYGLVMGSPTIGITAGSVSAEAMEVYGLPEGVYVSEVSDGSDAKKQGLQVGDIILEVNGTPVTTVAEVNAIKDVFAVGDTLTLTVYREGDTFEMDIMLVDKSVIR